jgi:hypothetical protein
LSFAGSNGSGFGACCPWKALATGPVVCPLAASARKNSASAKLALPVASVEITFRRDTAFIFQSASLLYDKLIVSQSD